GRGRACERLAFEPGERRSAPEREGLAEHGCCLSRVSRLERGATPLEKVLEPVEVDLSALYAEGITVGASLEHPLPEFPPEARDVDLEALACGAGRLIAPQLVDEAIGRDAVLPVQDQEREQR